MPYWLMKSEPDELSIHDLERLDKHAWMRRTHLTRRATFCAACSGLFLLSLGWSGHCGHRSHRFGALPRPDIYSDPRAITTMPRPVPPREPWSAVDVVFVEAFKRVIPLAQRKAQSAAPALPLVQKAAAFL